MTSLVWGRDPQEAFEEPYEYDIQKQFAREAGTLFERLYRLLNSKRHRYYVKDRSLEKAIWLLAMDALDSLRDCLKALNRKEHRFAGRLFRDVMETMDLAAFFHSNTGKSNRLLSKWYSDQIIGHREYRNYVKTNQNPEAAKRLSKHYSSLSRFTHRSYLVILEGYNQSGAGHLVHDGTGEIYGKSEEVASMLVLPQTIATYYAVLANLVLEYSNELSEFGLVSEEAIRASFAESLETETIPRRFLPRRWLTEKLQSQATQKK